MLSSALLLALSGLTAVQAKFHIGIWRFFNHTGCQMTNKLQDDWQIMTPGGCHSPSGEAEFDEVYYLFAQYPNNLGHLPDHYGYCQLNGYSEPHCEGKTVLKWKNVSPQFPIHGKLPSRRQAAKRRNKIECR